MSQNPQIEATDFIAEAITEWFGARCPEYAEGCAACDAWKQYDDLRAYLASQEAAAPSEEPVAIAGNVELLQHQLDTFGPSPDGAVERDLAYAKELRASPAVAPAMTPLGREFEEAWDRNAEALYESEPAVAPVAVSVKAKPLEWKDGQAATEFGDYSVDYDHDEDMHETPWACWSPVDSLGHFDTAEAGVIAAQADFNARILSSIIPATKGGEDRATRFLAWACNTFTADVATNIVERLMRFEEEAVELAHACEMPRATMDKILERVYGREPGNIKQEAAQSQVTLELLAKVLRIDLDASADEEFLRVQSIPKEHWDRRHAAKVAIGIATGAALSAQDTDGVAK